MNRTMRPQRHGQPAGAPGVTRHGAGARARWASALAGLLLAGCSSVLPPSTVSNRPDGEGYAGAGELVLRLGQMQPSVGGLFGGADAHRQERAYVELRYVGLDAYGRAVFRRHDVDQIAGKPDPQAMMPHAAIEASSGAGPALPPDTRDIVVDLRRARQIPVQGKIVEILEATSSGVVFRLY